MCPACYQPGGSLLHCPSTLTCLLSQTGGIFLLHCPWSRLRQTLSGTLPCEARTFLSRGLAVSRQRPPVLLTTCISLSQNHGFLLRPLGIAAAAICLTHNYSSLTQNRRHVQFLRIFLQLIFPELENYTKTS